MKSSILSKIFVLTLFIYIFSSKACFDNDALDLTAPLLTTEVQQKLLNRDKTCWEAEMGKLPASDFTNCKDYKVGNFMAFRQCSRSDSLNLTTVVWIDGETKGIKAGAYTSKSDSLYKVEVVPDENVVKELKRMLG